MSRTEREAEISSARVAHIGRSTLPLHRWQQFIISYISLEETLLFWRDDTKKCDTGFFM